VLAYDPFHLEGQSIKKEGLHFEAHRQILNILLTLKIYLHDDIISIITTFTLELYTNQENYIYAVEL
jgi:hypothetical protein